MRPRNLVLLGKVQMLIIEEVQRRGIHPYFINCGDCAGFAAAVADAFCRIRPRPKSLLYLVWGDELPAALFHGCNPESHCLLVLELQEGGFKEPVVYLDAEEPCGQLNPAALPIFLRQRYGGKVAAGPALIEAHGI